MKTSLIVAIAATGLLTACGNVDSSHLIFGQQHIVGLSISASAPEQGGSLTLGLRDHDIAIVPVAVKKANGDYMPMKATTTNPKIDKSEINVSIDREQDGKIEDAFSTLGNFELKGGATKSTGDDSQGFAPSVGLGKFFATGNAAQILAAGFREKLSASQEVELAVPVTPSPAQ